MDESFRQWCASNAERLIAEYKEALHTLTFKEFVRHRYTHRSADAQISINVDNQSPTKQGGGT
jgi:hypothetical protein